MISKKWLYYFTPALLSALMFASNFLSTNIFHGELSNFAVWFIISLFAFVCGWIINKTLGWTHGGRIVFAVIVATAAMSLFLVLFFKGYFGFSNFITENLILYTLRNVLLGTMGIFGMAVAELLSTQKELKSLQEKHVHVEHQISDAKSKAELITKEAKLNAKEILLNAEKEARSIIEHKNKIERQLKELIQTERELIKQYEKDEE